MKTLPCLWTFLPHQTDILWFNNEDNIHDPTLLKTSCIYWVTLQLRCSYCTNQVMSCYFCFILSSICRQNPTFWYHCLTFLSALFEAVIDLLKHGLAASFKDGQHDALERVFVGCLDWALHRFGCCSTDCICSVLETGTGYSENEGGVWVMLWWCIWRVSHLPLIWPPCWHSLSGWPPQQPVWQ